MIRRPPSLFALTALLMGGALLLFSLIAWQAIVWSALGPAADSAVRSLTLRAEEAIAAEQSAAPWPEGARWDGAEPAPPVFPRGWAYGMFTDTVRQGVQASLHSPEVRLARLVPAEVWIRVPQVPGRWLVLTWRLGGPKAPIAAITVLAAAALIVLLAAGYLARRLTASLSVLAQAAGRVANNETLEIRTDVGPREVQALAGAFKSMSLRLTEAAEQREFMLAGVSHDLRTPLARLRVAVELLDRPDSALLSEMTACIEEMDRMLGQFLRFVRANYREAPREAQLDQLVRDSLLAYSADSRLVLELQSGVSARFAVDCLRHALLNLVDNAFEYGRAPVTVRVGLIGRDVWVRVQDAGLGLNPAQWALAIRPFQRLTEQPAQGHSGLGLALVERLVQMCGGSLAAEQCPEGFRIELRLPTLT